MMFENQRICTFSEKPGVSLGKTRTSWLSACKEQNLRMIFDQNQAGCNCCFWNIQLPFVSTLLATPKWVEWCDTWKAAWNIYSVYHHNMLQPSFFILRRHLQHAEVHASQWLFHVPLPWPPWSRAAMHPPVVGGECSLGAFAQLLHRGSIRWDARWLFAVCHHEQPRCGLAWMMTSWGHRRCQSIIYIYMYFLRIM